jgi:hypothetical protein
MNFGMSPPEFGFIETRSCRAKKQTNRRSFDGSEKWMAAELG